MFGKFNPSLDFQMLQAIDRGKLCEFVVNHQICPIYKVLNLLERFRVYLKVILD